MTTIQGSNQLMMEDILDGEVKMTSQLIESLASERIAILESDAVSLENAARDKEQKLEQLSHLEQQRMSIMEQAGYNPSPDGMVFYLQQAQNTGDAGDLWQRLLTLAARCRDQNRENQQLVEFYSHHTHAALCIIRGEDPRQNVYDTGGNTRDQHERRTLAKA